MGTDASPYKVIECLLYRVLKASSFGAPNPAFGLPTYVLFSTGAI